MSLILDALRKSEAERRRGQKPDLFASVTLSPAPRRVDLLRFWPLPVFVALLLAAGFVLWRGNRESTGATSTPAASESTQDETSDSSVDGGAEAGMPPMSTGPTVADSSTAPPPARVASELGSDRDTQAPRVTPPSSKPTPTPAPTVSAPPVPTPAPATDSTASATPRNDEAQLEALPPIAILSASERSALPPLKLSMHVFGSEPAKRFAIIDGQRVTEGSSLGGSIIEEIRRDGVVLNINGRRILLPRP